MNLKTGIPKLDELLNGGINDHKSVLFYSTPGVENLPFAYQFLYSRLNNGDQGLYFVNNKKPDSVRFMLKNYGWDISEFEKNKQFVFCDCYSGLLGFNSREKFFVKDIKNLKEIDSQLTTAIKKLGNNNVIFIFDSLSSLLDINGEDSLIINNVKDWLERTKKNKITAVFLFTEWPYDKDIIKSVRDLFDCVIDLKAIERKIILRNYFTVSKANWLKQIKKQDIPFKITRPGGVKVYIPKVLVTGPYNAGKTSFIHSASTKAVSVDRLGTTVALDHGHVDFKGFSVDLWGTPGQERFDPIMELLGSESLGVIVVIDSTNPKGFARAKQMLEITKTQGLPSVIAANKTDLKGALKLSEIRKKMKIPKEIPIVPVIAEDLKQVKEDHPCKLRQKDIESILSKLFEMVI